METREAQPVPRPGSPNWVQRSARRILALFGWRLDILWPPVPKCVIIVYPHTSNGDFFVGYLALLGVGLPARWIGKDTIFRWPVAGLLRRMGGTPVNRRQQSGLTAQLLREFERRRWLWLAIAPEGTRARTDRWKSGFYHLALAAAVPVGLAFIDYGERLIGLRIYLDLTGDEEQDLARIRAAYAGKTGRHPDQASDIRFHADRPG